MVPLGPKLEAITSYKPFEALIDMKRAAPLPRTSALGFRVFTPDMFAGDGDQSAEQEQRGSAAQASTSRITNQRLSLPRSRTEHTQKFSMPDPGVSANMDSGTRPRSRLVT